MTPGNPWRYSNLGYQLLGLILQRAGGQDYPTLITERLPDPLSMTHSGVGPRGAGTPVPGHADGHEVPRWDQPWSAGGVEATIEDLARYARACLFPPPTPLGAAITLAQTPVVAVDGSTEQALAWIVHRGGVREHSGGTGGFSACVTIDHERGRAVAILVSNQGSPAYSAYLKQAAQSVLAGQDPRQAGTPRTVALLAGRRPHSHPRFPRREDRTGARAAGPESRDKITTQQLERAWTTKIRPAGPAADTTIVHHEIAASGAVVADIAIVFATEPQRLRMVVLPTGELGGLAFLP